MSQRFEFTELRLAGLHIIDPKPIEDSRGNLTRFFCANEFEQLGFKRPIAQMNTTLTKQKGVVRGMHFQSPPHDHEKLVYVVKGSILDVIVDLRKKSKTYKQHISINLSEDNRKSVFIPKGFAHGFIVLSKSAIFSYKVDNYYNPDSESGVLWSDLDLNIDWKINKNEIIVSEKDKNLPTFNEIINPF